MLPANLLDLLRPPRMRPALWHALEDLSRRRDPCAVHHHQAVWNDFVSRYREWRPLWCRHPELAAIGFDLLDRSRPEIERVQGCIWLTMFPSLETVAAMGRIALDASEPVAVRNQATWTLGYRQLDDSDDALQWSAEAVSAADATLLSLWRTPARDTLSELLPAMRHVSSEGALDLLADDVLGACAGLEAFATPRLAHALVDRLEELPSEHAHRLVRLVGHVLGAEVVPKLLAYSESAPLAARVEALMTALSLDASRARPAVDSWLSTLTFDRVARERAAWHEAHPGILPTVRALAIARNTAAIPARERSRLCTEAAHAFEPLAALEPYYEDYLYTMWARVAFRSRDDAAIIKCTESAPSMLERSRFLVAPYLDALARTGRFDLLIRTASEHPAAAQASWLLATHGRPFCALAMRRMTSSSAAQPEALAAGVIALFLAGRPDLAMAALERERPRSQYLAGLGHTPFPGPDELWRIEHEPESCPALVALVGGLAHLLSSVRGAPDHADPDRIDFGLLAEREQDLRTDLAGATVCILGEVENKSDLVSRLQAQGASIVDGPFARIDYYVAGPGADPSTITRLRTMGVRELPAL